MISWFAKSTKDVVTRQLSCYILKAKIGPKKLDNFEPDKNIEAFNTVKNAMLVDFTEEDGTETVDFNWDFILFEATDHQLKLVTEPFLKDKKEEPKKKGKGKLVDLKGNNIK